MREVLCTLCIILRIQANSIHLQVLYLPFYKLHAKRYETWNFRKKGKSDKSHRNETVKPAWESEYVAHNTSPKLIWNDKIWTQVMIRQDCLGDVISNIFCTMKLVRTNLAELLTNFLDTLVCCISFVNIPQYKFLLKLVKFWESWRRYVFETL